MNDLFYKQLTLKNVIFLIGIIVTLIFSFKNADIVLMLFVSVVIACSLNPLVDKLEAKNMKRSTATALILGGFVFLLIVCIVPVVCMGVYEISTFADSFKRHIFDIYDYIGSNKLLNTFGLTQDAFKEQLLGFINNIGDIFGKTVDILKSLSSAFVYIFISAIFTFFLMVDKDKVRNNTLRLFPRKMKKRVGEILDVISQKISGYMVAQAYAIASVGIVMLIGLLIFHVKYAVILALMTAILDLIPVVGPAIALVICVITVYKSGIWVIAAVIGTFAAAQLIENNFVRPYAFSKLLNIHPILVFAFLYIGAKYFGVVGALFAPAIAALICVLIEEIYIKSIE